MISSFTAVISVIVIVIAIKTARLSFPCSGHYSSVCHRHYDLTHQQRHEQILTFLGICWGPHMLH